MKFSTRQLVLIAVFGTLWGALEMSLGSVFKAVNLPFGGAVMAAVGLMVAMTGRIFVPHRGATLFVGVIAMLLKLFSVGSVVVGPMFGILAEALIAELVLSMFSTPNQPGFLIAGAAGVLWTVFQPFLTGVLLFGRELFIIWLDLLDRGQRAFGLPPNSIFGIVIGLVLVHVVLGGLAGWIAWNTGALIRARLHGPSPQNLNTSIIHEENATEGIHEKQLPG